MKLALASIPVYRRRVLIAGLKKLHSALTASPLAGKYWVCGGALLGWAREGGLLPHDPDMDFHYWQSDARRMRATVDMLLAVGFKFYCCWRNHKNEIVVYTLKYRGVGFDFFACHRDGENICYYSFGMPQKGAADEQWLCGSPAYELAEFELLKMKWLKPADHETYLTAHYGAWRTPVKSWEQSQDNKAIISRRAPGKKSRTLPPTAKKIIGYTSGVWDLFHTGHLRAIQIAAAHCDYLIVGVTSDASCAEYKRTPMIPFSQRWEIISGLKMVDKIIEAPNYPTAEFYAANKIDICIQGDPHPGAGFYEVAEKLGIMKYEDYQEITSTTEIIKRVRQK